MVETRRRLRNGRWLPAAPLLVVAAVLGLGLLAVGCDDGGQGPSGDFTPGQTFELNNTPPATLPPGPSATPGAQRAPDVAAAEDLAVRFEVAAAEIEVISVTPMDWPDACLGLGESGETCAEVVTPGFEVLLSFGTTQFTYHTTADGTIVRFAGFDIEGPVIP